MRIDIIAVGRAGRDSPEHQLSETYNARSTALGAQLALGPVAVHSVEDRQSRRRNIADADRPAREAKLLMAQIPENALVVTLDATGRQMSSEAFADALASHRDQGIRNLAFVIGGAQGLAPELRTRAQWSLSFGAMIWPHMLARVMLSEQIYRAVTILVNHPYHRA